MIRSATRIELASVNARRRRDDLLRQRRRDRHDLERRAGLVDVGDGAVAPPVGGGERKAVGVVAGRDRHREHGAGVRVEDDRVAGLRPPALDRLAEDGLGVRLDAVVDREEDVVARPLRLRRDHVDHAAGRVGDRRLAARLADQLLVERALEAFEAVVVDAGEAEHVRGDSSLRVVALLLGVEAEPGQVLLLELRGLRRIGLPLDVDEVARSVGEQRVERIRVDAERLRGGERDASRLLHEPRVGVHRRRLLADRERLAGPVVDRAAAGGDLGRVLLLARRDALERRRLDALQPDRPAERAGEDEREETEEKADAAVGGPLAHGFGGASCTCSVSVRVGAHEPEPRACLRLDPGVRGRARELRAEAVRVGAQLDPLAAELVELDVELEHGDVDGDDARQQDGERRRSRRRRRTGAASARRARPSAAAVRGCATGGVSTRAVPAQLAISPPSPPRGASPRRRAGSPRARGRPGGPACASGRAAPARCRSCRSGTPAGRCSRAPARGSTA